MRRPACRCCMLHTDTRGPAKSRGAKQSWCQRCSSSSEGPGKKVWEKDDLGMCHFLCVLQKLNLSTAGCWVDCAHYAHQCRSPPQNHKNTQQKHTATPRHTSPHLATLHTQRSCKRCTNAKSTATRELFDDTETLIILILEKTNDSRFVVFVSQFHRCVRGAHPHIYPTVFGSVYSQQERCVVERILHTPHTRYR